MYYLFQTLLISFVTFQFAKAQTIQPIARKSNCSNGIYADYVAKVTSSLDKISVDGVLLTNFDSVNNISFFIENGFTLINGKKKDIKISIENIRYGGIKKIFTKDAKTSIKLLNIHSINNKKLYIDIEVSNHSFEFELICCFEFKNGCKYLTRQKIIS